MVSKEKHSRCSQDHTMWTLSALVGLVFFLTSCTETIVSPPVESSLPGKLYPYETVYDSATYRLRRDHLARVMPPDGIAIIATNDIYSRNGDVQYEFRPSSSFYYLTGFDEPQAVAIVRRNPAQTSTSELILFVQTREGAALRWLGPVCGPEGAIRYFGADSAYEFSTIGSYLRSCLRTGSFQRIYTAVEANQGVTDSILDASGGTIPLLPISTLVDPMRLIKCSLEQGLMRYAVDVSVQAFREGMRSVRPGAFEYEVDAIFDYVLRLNGCPRSAFPTIVASGPNSNILHYDANRRRMEDGDLVMIDFGAEYGYYASDITRTLPVNGRFSVSQATIYNIVLNAHRTVLANVAPGKSYYALYSMNRDMIVDELLQHGVIQGNRSEIISSGRFRQYIPAGLAHSVGLDVHDPFPREENGDLILKEHMVMAFEPHVYLSDGDQTVDPQYWNVCTRIEDMVLITSNGCTVLTAPLATEIRDIEALMRR